MAQGAAGVRHAGKPSPRHAGRGCPRQAAAPAAAAHLLPYTAAALKPRLARSQGMVLEKGISRRWPVMGGRILASCGGDLARGPGLREARVRKGPNAGVSAATCWQRARARWPRQGGRGSWGAVAARSRDRRPVVRRAAACATGARRSRPASRRLASPCFSYGDKAAETRARLGSCASAVDAPRQWQRARPRFVRVASYVQTTSSRAAACRPRTLTVL